MKYIGVSTPAWTMPGGREEVDWRDLGEDSVPGPGNYKRDPSDKVVYESAPTWKIGKEKRSAKSFIPKSSVPGPGKYNPYVQKKERKRFIRKNGEKEPFITKEKRFKRSKRD